MNSTVLVDIKEQDLVNFTAVDCYNLYTYSEAGHKSLFENYPFTLYKKRMMGESFVTIQVPIINYCLFLGSGLVK